MTTPVLFASPELVLAAWIKTIPGFAADSVDPVLPADDTTWKRHGAVTMMTVGGTEHPYLAVSKTVLQVECWCCNPGSNKPPWNASWSLARQIQMACKDRFEVSREVAVSANGVTYPSAEVRSVVVMNVARRAYGMKSDYAGHLFDVLMTWTQVGLTTR